MKPIFYQEEEIKMSDSMYTEICHNDYFELLKPKFEHMEGKYCAAWKGQFEK